MYKTKASIWAPCFCGSLSESSLFGKRRVLFQKIFHFPKDFFLSVAHSAVLFGFKPFPNGYGDASSGFVALNNNSHCPLLCFNIDNYSTYSLYSIFDNIKTTRKGCFCFFVSISDLLYRRSDKMFSLQIIFKIFQLLAVYYRDLHSLFSRYLRGDRIKGKI
jgi:hypothetical protein